MREPMGPCEVKCRQTYGERWNVQAHPVRHLCAIVTRMIQRKQTIFLVLAALISFTVIWVPFATYTVSGSDQAIVFRSTGLYMADGTPVADASPKVPFAAVFGLLGALLLVAVFLFKNRPRQARLVRYSYLFALGILAFAVITDRSVQVYLGQQGTVTVAYGVAFAAPLAVLILAFLAERGIRKDEALVKSLDRLR